MLYHLVLALFTISSIGYVSIREIIRITCHGNSSCVNYNGAYQLTRLVVRGYGGGCRHHSNPFLNERRFGNK